MIASNTHDAFEAILQLEEMRRQFVAPAGEARPSLTPTSNIMRDTRYTLGRVLEAATSLGLTGAARKVEYLSDLYGTSIPDRNAMQILSDLEHLG